MNRSNIVTTSIAAVAGATLLVATPTSFNASTPRHWEICPAMDTEPLCDLAAEHALTRDAAGPLPAVTGQTTQHSTAIERNCSLTSISRIRACAQ